MQVQFTIIIVVVLCKQSGRLKSERPSQLEWGMSFPGSGSRTVR